VFVLVSFFSAFESRSGNSPVPTGPGGEAVTDTYTFVHQELAGDGTLTTRVISLSGAYTSPWAKAGIILEPDTNQGTAYGAVMVTGSHGVRMQYDYTHDSPGLAGAVGPSSPRWLRLTRAGDVITGYDSADGDRWTEIGTVRLTGLPRTVQIGLFVTSPMDVATATFDHISARGDLPRQYWAPDAIAAGSYSSLPSAATWRQRSAGAFTITGSGDIAPLVGGEGAATHWGGASIVNGTVAALLFVIVLAALSATSEYCRKLIRVTFAASPRRGRVLAAKAAVAGSLAFAAGDIATAIAEVITRHVFAANGNYLFPQSGPDTARVIIGTGLLLGFAAVLVVALGAMLRRGAVTVAAGIVLLVVPGVLGSQSGSARTRHSPSRPLCLAPAW
jgi:regulation of enolase protein 1 (concanavalin A-like superfamily)